MNEKGVKQDCATVLCKLQNFSALYNYSQSAQGYLDGRECVFEIRPMAPKSNMMSHDFL